MFFPVTVLHAKSFINIATGDVAFVLQTLPSLRQRKDRKSSRQVSNQRYHGYDMSGNSETNKFSAVSGNAKKIHFYWA